MRDRKRERPGDGKGDLLERERESERERDTRSERDGLVGMGCVCINPFLKARQFYYYSTFHTRGRLKLRHIETS